MFRREGWILFPLPGTLSAGLSRGTQIFSEMINEYVCGYRTISKIYRHIQRRQSAKDGWNALEAYMGTVKGGCFWERRPVGTRETIFSDKFYGA